MYVRTPSGIVELDSNMLLMKNRIMLSKLTYVGKIMAKSTSHNMCRRALLNGKNVCKGKNLLTKCERWFREPNRERLNGGTVQPDKTHPGGTVPPDKTYPGGTVAPYKR